MTINTPALKPSRIFSNETDFGTSAAAFIWKKIVNNQNWVNQNIPVGFIMFFYASQTFADGTPIEYPSSDIWIQCTGQQIVDVNSPLNGQYTPNFSDKFLKGSEIIGLLGGQTTINLSHNHGGQTGNTDDRQPDSQADSGSDYNTGAPHTHAIDSRLSSVEPIIPPYVELQVYMRYK